MFGIVVFCDSNYIKEMIKKPKRSDVDRAKATLKRWHASARVRGKTNAEFEIKKIYEIIQYFEENTDFNVFD